MARLLRLPVVFRVKTRVLCVICVDGALQILKIHVLYYHSMITSHGTGASFVTSNFAIEFPGDSDFGYLIPSMDIGMDPLFYTQCWYNEQIV